jgi:hypothetical protein
MIEKYFSKQMKNCFAANLAVRELPERAGAKEVGMFHLT